MAGLNQVTDIGGFAEGSTLNDQERGGLGYSRPADTCTASPGFLDDHRRPLEGHLKSHEGIRLITGAP